MYEVERWMLVQSTNYNLVSTATPDRNGILHKPQEGFPRMCRLLPARNKQCFVCREARMCIQVISCPNLDSALAPPTGRIQDLDSACEFEPLCSGHQHPANQDMFSLSISDSV